MMPTILYVEDNNDIREITASLLTKAGYNVITGTNGREGLSLCKEQRFDLIMTDIHMPVMDGNEFILKLSDSKVVPPVVALTYKGSDVVPSRHIAAVALKPSTTQSLINIISGALNKNKEMLVKGAA